MLVICYGLTVLIDMVTAVPVGAVLAALLFMRRMAEVADVELMEGEHPSLPRKLPPGVFVYDIQGPLFFGAAEKATSALGQIAGRARVMILQMDRVPAMDASGLVALESALEALRRHKTLAILTGLRPQPGRVLANAGIVEREGRLLIRDRIEDAIDAAEASITSKG